MIIDERQEKAFWDAIEVFSSTGALPHIMVIGSWAEYLYTYYFVDGYEPNVRTRDVDCFYPNIRKPEERIYITKAFSEYGFEYQEDTLTRVGRFIKENLLEISFLSRTVGAQQNGPRKIEAFQIYSEGIRDVNILEQYPMHIFAKGYEIVVPEPAVFIIQKLLAYPKRKPDYKKEKDIVAINELLPFVIESEQKERLFSIFDRLSDKEKKRILGICEERNIRVLIELLNRI